MMFDTNTPVHNRTRSFATLLGLALCEEDFLALGHQGFVSKELRRNRTYYKLRYRVRGRQRARYVRADQVATVEDELCQLQAQVRLHKRVRAHVRQARSLLRATKQKHRDLLAEDGHAFHGYEIRRSRR